MQCRGGAGDWMTGWPPRFEALSLVQGDLVGRDTDLEVSKVLCFDAGQDDLYRVPMSGQKALGYDVLFLAQGP
jgi:hypothetical protein